MKWDLNKDYEDEVTFRFKDLRKSRKMRVFLVIPDESPAVAPVFVYMNKEDALARRDFENSFNSKKDIEEGWCIWYSVVKEAIWDRLDIPGIRCMQTAGHWDSSRKRTRRVLKARTRILKLKFSEYLSTKNRDNEAKNPTETL